MASIKMTFSLDEETARTLDRISRRLDIAKSQIVREAVADYGERVGKLSEEERLRLLAVFDEVLPAIPPRPATDVDRELAEIRLARRSSDRDPTEAGGE